MKHLIVALAAPVIVAALVVAAGCASLATPEAPSSGSPAPGATGGAAVAVSQQVKDGAALYVAFACVRCHAPNGVGGVPNRLNVGGDDTIPALNNAFRDPSEQFHNAAQITQVMMQGSIISKKPGVINMPSWTGVVNDAQTSAIAAYILAGFPQVSGVAYDANPASAADIYAAYACITCHGQVGGASATPAPAPNPLSPDKVVPLLRNPADNVTPADMLTTIMQGSIPPPGKVGEILMPAWGQILSTQQVAKVLSYLPDGPKGKALPAPAAASPLPLASGAATPAAGASPVTSSSP
jgi:mono/diheme cytochrome c family protein